MVYNMPQRWDFKNAGLILLSPLLRTIINKMGSILVNGKAQEVEVPISLIDLIKNNKVEQPEMVSIQVNCEFVNRDDFNSTLLNNNDEVDFLYFMGGGSRC
jgi:sulfur carrier protein